MAELHHSSHAPLYYYSTSSHSQLVCSSPASPFAVFVITPPDSAIITSPAAPLLPSQFTHLSLSLSLSLSFNLCWFCSFCCYSSSHCVFLAMAFPGTKLVMVVLVLLSVMTTLAMAHGVEYEVKWDFPTTDKYYSATQGRTYKVGDSLKFEYMQEMHNVVKVGSVQDFTACTVLTPLSPEFADGHTSMTLDKPGAHYFICSIPGHCADGMKIKVLVKG